MQPQIPDSEDISRLKVTVMGLGVNGGGLASARFFASRGAAVTVTDMRGREALASSIDALKGFDIRYVLGRHELPDFEKADIVIKNPAVRPDSPYIKAAKRVETDISYFLRLNPGTVIAVTGSKGKSTTTSAIYHCLKAAGRHAFIGGNITVSPLSFIDEVRPGDPVVLELSSWQLADLKGMGVLRPLVAVCTSMMSDHMNRYHSMEEYMADKKLIFADQDPSCYTVLNYDDEWNRRFALETKGSVRWYADSPRPGENCAWLEADGRGYCSPDGSRAAAEQIVPAGLLVPGAHQRKNMLAAGLALRTYGLEAEKICQGLASFAGVEHRLEFFAEKNGVRWYNDSAATIPQAAAAALSSFSAPIVIICGGSDKNLDFAPMATPLSRAKSVILLKGEGSERIRALLDAAGTPYEGPFDTLEDAVKCAAAKTASGDIALLSPGCASFGMFANEFDRGLKFKAMVRKVLGIQTDPA